MTLSSLTRRSLLAAAVIGALAGAVLAPATGSAAPAKPQTIVLVHGAFADSSSWNGVIPLLEAKGYHVVSAANPLRSLSGDAANVGALVQSIPGPVVLVGHSYGGSVITNAAVGHANVKALVYVAALAPDAGESAFDLVGKFPGSILGASLSAPVALPDGSHDLFVDEAKFAEPLAADLKPEAVSLLAATQRPVTDTALKEKSAAAGWKQIPSWFVYGTGDKSIPAATHQFMAERAQAKKVVAVPGASHLVILSHADTVASVIEAAAQASGE